MAATTPGESEWWMGGRASQAVVNGGGMGAAEETCMPSGLGEESGGRRQLQLLSLPEFSGGGGPHDMDDVAACTPRSFAVWHTF